MGEGHVTEGIEPKRIFISYGHDEYLVIAQKLKNDLQARGHAVWFDADRIKPGGDWERYIEDGLRWVSEGRKNGRIVLIMTPHSVRRPDGFCLNEITRAIEMNVKLVPIMLVWCEPPLSICRIQWLEMMDCIPIEEREDRYGLKLQRLVEALEHDKLDFEGFHSVLFNALKPLSFDADIKYNIDRFTGRAWVFDDIDRWLSESRGPRIYWIAGSPGVGKTAISAWLCAHRREVVAFHFCRHDNVQKIDPRRCVMSIAYQLSTQLPEYEERLKHIRFDDIDGLNARALFDHLVVQPLSANYGVSNRTIVILIDGLDEATVDGKNELAGFLAAELERAPPWLKLIITSRPDPEIISSLQAYTPFVLDISDPRNDRDIREFLNRELRRLNGNKDVLPSVVESIATKSEGLFIYAEWILRELENKRLSLDRIDDFPRGLGGSYLKFFERQFPDIQAWETKICPALEVLCASQEPLSLKTLSAIFCWNAHDERRFKRSLGSLFSVNNNIIQPFHKSIMEWLTNSDKPDQYYISITEGHRILAEYGWKKFLLGSATWPSYLISYLPLHLCNAGMYEELRRVLANNDYLRIVWEKDRFNLLKQWVFIEEHSDLRILDLYGPAIASPDKWDDKYLLVITELLRNTFHLDEAYHLLDHLIPHYRNLGDLKGLQQCIGSLASILITESEFERAMALLKEEEEICRSTDQKDGLQFSLLNQAIILNLTNHFDDAMVLLNEQESICREIVNLNGLQESLGAQALIHRAKGEFEVAMQLLKEREKICRDTSNIDGLQSSLLDLSLILLSRGEMDQAFALSRDEENLCRIIGNKEYLGNALYVQAIILSRTGEPGRALMLIKESERICNELGIKFALSESLGVEAFILMGTHRLEEAQGVLKEREKISRSLEDRWGLQSTFGQQAVILRMQGDLNGAMALHREEERICREIGHKRDLAMSLSNQAIILRMKGDLGGALILHKEATLSLREIGYKYGLQEALGEQALTLYEKGDTDEARALLKEQASLCAEMGLLQTHDARAFVKEKESVL